MASDNDINWSVIAPPLVFETEETVSAFTDLVVTVHHSVVEEGICFDGPIARNEADRIIGNIESVVQNCFGIIFGLSPEDRYEDIFSQVSDFAIRFAKDHIFNDGNKRTALITSILIIYMRPVVLNIKDDIKPENNDVYKWIQAAVIGERNVMELASDLRKIAHPRD